MVKARLNVPGLIIFFAKDICHICLNINMLIISRTGYWVQRVALKFAFVGKKCTDSVRV